MNSFKLKVLACILMFIDHLGAIIFINNDYLRIIGRLSFPIFAFMIVEGYFHSKDIKKYFIRLGLFAIVPQIPYTIAFGPGTLNIFFTLFIGLLAIFLEEKIANRFLKYLAVILLVIFAQVIEVDYGFYGVLLIYIFKIFRNNFKALFFSFLILNLSVFNLYPFQYYSIFSLIFIRLYNGQLGLRNLWVKYGFYLFYPLHILAIYGFSLFLNRF